MGKPWPGFGPGTFALPRLEGLDKSPSTNPVPRLSGLSRLIRLFFKRRGSSKSTKVRIFLFMLLLSLYPVRFG
jgi:hypothetical protein